MNNFNFQCSGRYASLIALVATLGGFLFGYDLAVISGVNIFLREQFNLSDIGFAFATMSALLGCVTGPFLGGWLCDRIGRERTLMAAAILLGVSAILTAIAGDMLTLNVFRIIGGVGVGLCSLASPMYIAEVAPPRIRGTLGVMYQLAIVIGSVAAVFVTWALAAFLPELISWRWMFASEMVFVLIFLVLLPFLPSSPRWLAEQKRFNEALEVLAKINGSENAEKEINEIRVSLAEETGTWSELLRPTIRLALLIAFLLAIFNGWTGWGEVAGYLPALIQKANVSGKADAILRFAIAYGFQAIMTVVSMLLIDRIGRRPLWLFASSLMTIALILLGIAFHFSIGGVVVLLIVCLVAVPHALALGPLPWLMMSELFPTRIRARAVSLTTTVLWIFMFAGGFIFPILAHVSEKIIGSISGAIWFFAGICVLSLLFGVKLLPETKGKTLENITAHLKDRH